MKSFLFAFIVFLVMVSLGSSSNTPTSKVFMIVDQGYQNEDNGRVIIEGNDHQATLKLERPTDNGGKVQGSATVGREGLEGVGMKINTPFGKNGHFSAGASVGRGGPSFSFSFGT
jgi:hypothetical protein